ncbi:MAG: diacylglycerol kinase family protein [Candidatus Kerfeldbacteria bacterium]
MAKKKINKLRKSFYFAWRGVKYTFLNEQNFRLQLLAAIIVVICMAAFRIKQWEAVALILMVAFVLTAEILNTVLERFVDILQPRLHVYSEIIKDMMAALVLLSSISALLIGFIIFYPYFYTLIADFVL